MEEKVLIQQDEQSGYYKQSPKTSVCVGVSILNALIFYEKANRLGGTDVNSRIENFKECHFKTNRIMHFYKVMESVSDDLSYFRIPATFEMVKDEIDQGRCVHGYRLGHVYLIIGANNDKTIDVLNYGVGKDDSENVVEKVSWDDIDFLYSMKDEDGNYWGSSLHIEFYSIFPTLELTPKIMARISYVQKAFGRLRQTERSLSGDCERAFLARIENLQCIALNKSRSRRRKEKFCQNKSLKDGLFCWRHKDFVMDFVVPEREKSRRSTNRDNRLDRAYAKKVIELQKNGCSNKDIDKIMKKFLKTRARWRAARKKKK